MSSGPPEGGEPSLGRLQWLMVGRLAVTTLLLGGTLLLTVDESGYHRFTPRAVLALIVATYAASLVFALVLPRARSLDVVATVQIAWDLLFVSGLVYLTGGANSGFSVLFGVVILMAGIVIGPRALQTTGLLSLFLYLAVGTLVGLGVLPHPPDQQPSYYRFNPGELALDLLLNGVALALVALLAGNLAFRLRRTGGKLLRAERDVADLARLNDHIVRSLSSGLVTVDLSGRVQTINPAGAEMFRAERSELEWRPAIDLLPFPSHPEGPTADPATVHRGEGIARRLDGTTFPVGFSQSPLVDASGQVIGTLISFQDLTEIQKLRDAAERAERLAALGRLAASLAHEIRNPLGSISGSVELVREAPVLGEEDRRLLGIVLTETERLNDLVTTMLDVARPSLPSPTETDLARLANDVVDMARQGPAAALGIEVACTGPEQLVAVFDSSQIRQVLWNLIKNAIQASPPGAEIRVRVGDGEDGSVFVEVEDEGTGIDEDAREHLFEMFYSGRPHGVGLGLALVQQIVEAHGGSVEVESPPGRGATFRVHLPKMRAAEATGSYTSPASASITRS